MCKLPNHSGLEHAVEGAPRIKTTDYGSAYTTNYTQSYKGSVNTYKPLAAMIQLTNYNKQPNYGGK